MRRGTRKYGKSKERREALTMRYCGFVVKDLVCLCAGARDDEAWEEWFPGSEGPSASPLCARLSVGRPSRQLVEDLRQAKYVKYWKTAVATGDFSIQPPKRFWDS